MREYLGERARCHEQLDAATAVAWQHFQRRVADWCVRVSGFERGCVRVSGFEIGASGFQGLRGVREGFSE